jgi:WD40 repeat protein
VSAPETSFYVTGGTLRHDAPSYVERQADCDVFEGLLAGEFCYVLTPRQMGKSSLMVRTASKLREQGVSVIALDLTAIGQNLTAEQWYDGLVVRMGRQLRLDEDLERFWRAHERLGPCQRLFMAIRDVVLRQRPGPLAIFVDEVDSVRSLPFSIDEFFAAIRECYNRRAEDAEFNRLTFCLLGVAVPSDLIRDTRTTPFNIGRRIELHDFTPVEAAPLAQGLRGTVTPDAAHSSAPARGNAAAIILTSGRLLTRILHWTGGHPYLTQRFCRAVAEDASVVDPTGVDRICEDLFLSSRARERDDNLLFVRERLLRSETDLTSLLELYRKVRGGKPVPDDETSRLVSVLRLSGIVASEAGFLRERNRIYSRVFDEEWIRAHLPDADVRRQRAAYYHGVIRTTAIAAVVVAMMGGLVTYARWQARRAESALERLTQATRNALHAQSQSRRLLGLAGQRFDGLEGIRSLVGIERSIELRNEAIACLALSDLRPNVAGTRLVTNSMALALGDNLDRYAHADAAGRISIRRWLDNSELKALPGSIENVELLQLSPGGGHVAAAHALDGRHAVSVFRLASGERLLRFTNAISGRVMDFSHDDGFLVVGGADSTLRVIELTNGQTVRRLDGPALPVAIRFRPGTGQFAVAWTNRFTVDLMDATPGGTARNMSFPSGIEALAWSPNGHLLAVACADRRVFLWNMDTGGRLTLDGHQGVPDCIVFSSSGRMLASAGGDQTLRLWDCLAGGKPMVTLVGPRAVRQLAFVSDERQLAAVVGNGTIHVWDLAPAVECRALADPAMRGIADFDVSPDGRWLACAQPEGVTFWDVETGRVSGSLSLGETRDVAFNPANGELFSSDLHGVNRFPMEQHQTERGMKVELGPGRSLGLRTQSRQLSCSANGELLAIAWSDSVIVVRASDGTVRARLQGGPDITSAAISGDGRWVAAAHAPTGGVRVWDWASNSPPTVLQAGEGAQVTFAPSGEWLAAGAERDWRLWQTESWKEVLRIQRNSAVGGPAAVAFTPDSLALAVARADSVVDFIKIPSGAPLASFEPPRRDPTVALRFSPDGTRLFCGTEGTTVWVWDLPLLRSELAGLGLDWPSPPLPPRGVGVGTADLALTVGNAIRGEEISRRVNRESDIHRITLELEQKPADPNPWRMRAVKYDDLRDYAKAVADWRHYLTLTNDPWAWRDLAWIHVWGPTEMQDFDAARSEATEAVRLEPGNSDNHYRLAAAWSKGGEYAAALTNLERAERLVRPDVTRKACIAMLRAICLARLGRTHDATALYEQAQRMMSLPPSNSKQQIEWQHLEREAKLALGN